MLVLGKLVLVHDFLVPGENLVQISRRQDFPHASQGAFLSLQGWQDILKKSVAIGPKRFNSSKVFKI